MRPIGFYNYTVIATYLGFASAFLGCHFAVNHQTKNALFCLILAGCFDMVDGKIASTRSRTTDEKNFGIQIDSLCDLVSFGVLPALLLQCFHLPSYISVVLGSLFTLSALIRLSYFNVTELNRQAQTNEHRAFYEGLPVTCDALILPFTYLFSPLLGESFGWFYSAALLLCGILFLAPFKLKKATTRGMFALGAIGISILIGMILLPV